METPFEHRKHHEHGKNPMKRLAFGLVVIAAGFLWMLKNLGMISEDAAEIIFSWPMILLAIGFVGLFGHDRIWPIVLMIVGGFYLYANFYEVPVNFRLIFWPSLLIIIGLFIILKAGSFFHKHHHGVQTAGNDVIDEVNIFGGGEIRITSQNFKGGKITAIFGGSKINLLDAQLAEGVNVIEITAIFGGFTLLVPPEWHTKQEMASIFGGVADKRPTGMSVNTSRTLVIKGAAIFGGGEIKSIYQ